MLCFYSGMFVKSIDICLFFIAMMGIGYFLNYSIRIIVAINWKRYHLCTYPLHIWIVVRNLFEF